MDNKKGNRHTTSLCSVGMSTPQLRRRHLAEAMSLALAMGAGAPWTPANAGSLTCPGSTSVTVSTTTTNSAYCSIGPAGSLTNDSTLNNFSTLVNNGYLFNTVYGTLNTYGYLGNAGALENAGTLNNRNSMDNSGTVTNIGGLHNYGNLTNESGGDLITTVSYTLAFGSLDNAGTLTNMSGGQVTNLNVLANLAGATLNNDGDLFTAGYSYGQYAYGGLLNSGDLNNAAGAVLLNRGPLVNYAGATLTNAGTLTNQDGAEIPNATLTNDGILTNTGTLTGYGTLTNTGTLNNSGTLTNLGELSPYAQAIGTINNLGVLNNSGQLLNESRGKLTNAGTLNNQSGGTLTNAGAMFNYGTVTDAGTLANSSTIVNDGVMTISVSGSLTGSGRVLQDQATGGTLTADGTLTQGSMDIAGGLLDGTGTLNVASPIVIGSNGIIDPGNPGMVGTLTSEGTIDISGTLNIDLASVSSFDKLQVTGASSKVIFESGSKINFIVDQGYTPSVGDTFDFLSAADGVTGTFSYSFSGAGLPSGLTARVLDILNNTGLELGITAVPLPGSGWLFLSGVIGLVTMSRRRCNLACVSRDKPI